MFTPSFVYGGSTADLTILQKHETGDGNRAITEWISPDQTLTLRVTKTIYPAFPVAEAVPELICSGA